MEKLLTFAKAFSIMVLVLQAKRTIDIFNKESNKEDSKFEIIMGKLFSSFWFTWLIFCSLMLFDIK